MRLPILLVAHGLSTASGHDYQPVPTGKGVGDDGFLRGPEVIVPEVFFQQVTQVSVRLHDTLPIETVIEQAIERPF